MKCIVTEATINTREGVARETGKPYRMDNQPATLEFPNGERRNIELQHDPKDAPLPVGEYVPKPTAYYLDSKKNIVVSRRARSWEPVQTAKAVKAA
ncbi:hypothetical protein QFW80_04145 [Luteimonas sp. M1R5S18]|uniref:Single-stranded DNA-binding protein n=1 Tax=Luteimonas rhizosphaericola TaxID=3042024 RepID=A0ABT6JGF9_9GAMM|nr:hypothetical protein [Luteimonas rhizosphaericola]MDH5829709.1 hypothetical protein [Luteimonas rhizosphaericola]